MDVPECQVRKPRYPEYTNCKGQRVPTKRKCAPKRVNGHDSKSVFQLVSKKTRHQDTNDGPSALPGGAAKSLFTIEDLHRCLFAQNDVRLINFKPPAVAKESGCFWCEVYPDNSSFQCPLHKHKTSASQQTSRLPMALRSLPPEVGLCTSSIPGTGCGICAKQTIPVGAWIGPYEGNFVKPEDLSPSTDTSYMWEIFHEGKLSGYIDGSDLTVSSWMRFIRCARNKQEQNLFAFQYLGNVFYRTFKAIRPGEEMLVWYDEKYPQYLGIPEAIFDMGDVIPRGAGLWPGEVVVVSPHVKTKKKECQPLDTNSAASFFPSPPPSPLSSPGSPFRFAKMCDGRSSPRQPPPTENLGLKYPSWRKPAPIKQNSSKKQNNANLTADTEKINDRTAPHVGENSACAMNSVSSKSLCKNTSAQAPQPSLQYDHCTAAFIGTNHSYTRRQRSHLSAGSDEIQDLSVKRRL